MSAPQDEGLRRGLAVLAQVLIACLGALALAGTLFLIWRMVEASLPPC